MDINFGTKIIFRFILGGEPASTIPCKLGGGVIMIHTQCNAMQNQDIAGIVQMISPNHHFYEVIDISKDSQYNYAGGLV